MLPNSFVTSSLALGERKMLCFFQQKIVADTTCAGGGKAAGVQKGPPVRKSPTKIKRGKRSVEAEPPKLNF